MKLTRSYHLTKIEGCPNKSDAIPGMAYFAGTGPIGATCGKCQFYDSAGCCEQYRDMAGKAGPMVFVGSYACKYFEDRRQGSGGRP